MAHRVAVLAVRAHADALRRIVERWLLECRWLGLHGDDRVQGAHPPAAAHLPRLQQKETKVKKVSGSPGFKLTRHLF